MNAPAGQATLFDALLRFWTRWCRGVPVNWNRGQVALLFKVCRESPTVRIYESEYEASDLPEKDDGYILRRGAQDAWEQGWLDDAIDDYGRYSLVLGYMADSVEHRFACNLRREAEFIIIEMAADGGAALALPEAATARQMLTLAHRWPQVDERGRRIKAAVRFTRPARPYAG